MAPSEWNPDEQDKGDYISQLLKKNKLLFEIY